MLFAYERPQIQDDLAIDIRAPPRDNASVAKLYVGLSGYAYKEWQGEGRFYPPGLKQAAFLDYYSGRYNSLEGDGTWYRMPSEASVAKWVEGTPDGFTVSPKMHRDVTHIARLKPKGFASLDTFVKALTPLREAGKLGVILVQLPPNLKRDDELLGAFLAELPRLGDVRWGVEFRNETWHALEVEDALRLNGVAWVSVDTDDAEAQLRHTAGHCYVRLRKSDYTDEQLRHWATYLASRLAAGQDCFVYGKHMDAEAPWKWTDRILELVG